MSPTIPAPKKRQRKTAADWSPRLLEALAASGSITFACGEAGIDRTTFYYRRDRDSDFADAARQALARAVDALELEARRRAKDGITRHVLHQGAPVFAWVKNGSCVPEGTKGAQQVPIVEHEYSDTLLIFLLKAHRPKKYRERHQVEHSGRVNHDHSAADLSDAQLAAIVSGDARAGGRRASKTAKRKAKPS